MPPPTTSSEMATETTAEDLERNRITGSPSSQQPAPAWSVSASAAAVAAARKNSTEFSEDEEAEKRVRVVGGGLAKTGDGGGDSDDERRAESDPLGLSREARERGFLPSDAYCRQLDQEEEFDAIDAIADPGEAERRRRSGGGAVEEGGAPSTAEAPTAAAAASALAAAVEASSAAAATKRVRFEGVAAPWVPPHRRPGWRGGIGAAAGAGTATIITREGEEGGTAAARTAAAAGTTIATTDVPVPDYVLHPERYTCYPLGEPVTIGGVGVDDGIDGDEMEAAAREAAAAAAAARRASMTSTPAPEAAAAAPAVVPLGARLLPQDSLGAPRGRHSGRRAPGTPVAASGPLSFAGEHEEEEEEEEAEEGDDEGEEMQGS